MKRPFAFLLLAAFASLPVRADGAGLTAAAAPSGISRALAVATAAPDSGALALARAATEERRGNLRGVVEALEGVDYSHGPAFAGADRAAFLLAEAYSRLGDLARLDSLADAVGAWRTRSGYSQRVAGVRRLGPGALPRRVGDDVGPGDRSPLGLYADALRAADMGAEDSLSWTALAGADTGTALGRDLAGAACLHLATLALAHGQDARPWLERVPPRSRYATRALHLRGLAALERGEAVTGVALLTSALADSAYGARRELLEALGGAAFDRGDWNAARAAFERADQEWTAHDAALRRLLSPDAAAEVWDGWATNPDSAATLVLDGDAAGRADRRFSDASADLTASWEGAQPAAAVTSRPSAGGVAVEPPSPEALSRVAASARTLDVTRAERERTRWALERERESLADRRGYLGHGLDGSRHSAAELAPALARLDSLRGTLDSLDARLRALRDAEGRRLQARLDDALGAADRQALWLDGMQRLYVCGPDSARQRGLADGTPGPARVVASEQALVVALRAEAVRMRDATPALLARSYEQAWGPRLIDRITAQADLAAGESRWANALAATLDSGIVASGTSERMAWLGARAARLDAWVDSLTLADAALRARVAHDAVAQTLTGLQREREPIDYGLAASAYALAVQLSPGDSAVTPVAAGAGGAPAAGTGEEHEDPQAAHWRGIALPALQSFLGAHPRSAARGEMRFRLADLELLAARQEFRERMAGFLRPSADGRSARGAVPLLDPDRALSLYRQILAEDPSFAHMDAVRFNAGMILADAGDPEARRYFHDLVTLSPGSAYAQESWLRMGDMAFNDKRFAEGVTLYAHAADGGNPTLDVIADYKMGWAHFNQDEFLPAADAFRSVMDLYAAQRGRIGVDIEGEAEAYLVHSLAGAGGAPAFAAYFDRTGRRDYEKRVLMAMGQHFRRYGKFPEAAAADELVLSRFADQPEALLAAQRLVETHQRSNHPASVSAARAAYAARFAPGGAWYAAQAGDSVRAAGAAFARASYLAEAFEHHERARTSGAADDWRAALAAYRIVLAHWPDDPDAARFQLGAGEACLKLGDYPGALREFAAAERSGRDSMATVARLQQVAATDAWYESTRSGAARGSDSLAHAVLAAGDAYLAASPRSTRGPDILWRMSQLELAHGWDERAAADLGRMAGAYPADARTPLAATQQGETFFRMGRFADAGQAFEGALSAARAQGRDSLARRAAAALPVCAYRDAEASVAADSTRHAKHAEMFEAVAARWPDDALAPRALYRAGIARARAGEPREAVRVLQALLQRYPKCEFVGDARLQVATLWDGMGEREQAAQAWLDVSRDDPDRESAATAWLRAGDLMAAAGQASRADDLRLEYLRRYPDDAEAGMQITEDFARREVRAVDAAHPVSALLAAPAHAGRNAAPPSHLADYLVRAKAHPALASRALVAQVRFLQGEEAGGAFAAAKLSQPLAKSVVVKKRLLDTLLVRYRRSADLGVPEWAHASAFRMGQALTQFADALEHSEAPADLAGDDLRAYRSVLTERARAFAVRGEDVWADLLRHVPADAPDDAWLGQARGALYPRLAARFLFRPEVEFPVVAPEDRGPAQGDSSGDTDAPAARAVRTLAQRERNPR